MSSVLRALAGTLLGIASLDAYAQCANSMQPSCGVYESCFAKYCPCDGKPTEYFRSYGAKYCKSFLENKELSANGKKWRDSTLVCLQESIVPHLDISAAPQCNCSSMRQLAFDSHVACYTKAGASICDLPASDVKAIGTTADVKDLFDAEGWKQMRDISIICARNAPDDGRRAIWKGLAATLKLRSP